MLSNLKIKISYLHFYISRCSYALLDSCCFLLFPCMITVEWYMLPFYHGFPYLHMLFSMRPLTCLYFQSSSVFPVAADFQMKSWGGLTWVTLLSRFYLIFSVMSWFHFFRNAIFLRQVMWPISHKSFSKKNWMLFSFWWENEDLWLTISQMLALLLCDAMQNVTVVLQESYVQFKLLTLQSPAGVLWGCWLENWFCCVFPFPLCSATALRSL